MNLKHGAWYPFLIKVGIDPSGATRRMALAKKYLLKSGLLKVDDYYKSEILSVIDAGVKKIAENHAELHGLEREGLWKSLSNQKPAVIMVAGVPTQPLFGFSLEELLKRASRYLPRYIEKGDVLAAETLEMRASILNGWSEAILRVAQLCSEKAKDIRKII